MDGLTALDAALLLGAGLLSGVLNTLAGGGSILTVPLLVLLGLPGTVANGTNRVGILVQSLVASWRFHRQGALDPRELPPILLPLGAGVLVGAFGAAQLPDRAFERVFGVAMLVLLVPTLRELSRTEAPASPPRGVWSPAVRNLAFAGIGVYLGALQAGVGLPLLAALLHSGHGPVRGNALKVAVIAASTLVAVPVFAWHAQIAWAPACVLALGFAGGGEAGARLAVWGGARVVRPVLALALVLLAARMLGLFS